MNADDKQGETARPLFNLFSNPHRQPGKFPRHRGAKVFAARRRGGGERNGKSLSGSGRASSFAKTSGGESSPTTYSLLLRGRGREKKDGAALPVK